MNVEKKRSLLRISREKARNPNFVNTNSTNIIHQETASSAQVQNKKVDSSPVQVNRIKTKIKSSYLGGNLSPDYIGKYKDCDFIVAGCGSSMNSFTDFSKYYVVGVNDIERILTPDFLVVVNDYRTFTRGRWEWVRDSMSPVIFSHMTNPGPINRKESLALLKLGKRNNPDLSRTDSVDHTMNSPYMGVIIAYQLGAKKIGLVGVDFTQDHFFSKSGTHKLTKGLKNINEEYGVLRAELEKRGVKVANLSTISMLSSWPKMSLEEFDRL